MAIIPKATVSGITQDTVITDMPTNPDTTGMAFTTGAVAMAILSIATTDDLGLGMEI